MSESKPVRWNTIKLTDKQVAHIEMLATFHLDLSTNKIAKERTKRLQWCMKNWINQPT